jgi:disulfide bond formation protein DsbB
MPHSLILARRLALLLPLALIAGALGSQYIGHLFPCEMCHWQRWPHYTAILIAALAFVVPGRGPVRALVTLAALAIAISGAIGAFHAGVEYHWWEGITACSQTASGHGGSADEILARLMNAPIVRCDSAQWTLFGISLAGFNAILSLGGAGVIAWLLVRKPA